MLTTVSSERDVDCRDPTNLWRNRQNCRSGVSLTRIRLEASQLTTLNTLWEQRMPQYTLTLTLTNPPADPHRRGLAIAAAHRHGVDGWNGNHLHPPGPPDIIDNPDGTVTWMVEGTPDNVCLMINDWTHPPNHPNQSNVRVTQSGGPALPCVPAP
jgi:hypothetical protein